MKKRNLGLDLCRILSMLGIVVLHVVGKGGVLKLVNGVYTAQYWATEWVYICALCSVNVFALMSGYLGINKKPGSVYRSIELMAVVLFFSTVITACFVVVAPGKFLEIKTIIKGVFPPLADRYWYITNFIPILILQPYINKMILSLTDKQHLSLCIVSLLLFTVVPSALRTDFFRFDKGYSFVWLLCLYVLGAYLKRERVDEYKIPRAYLASVFFGLSVLLLGGNIFIQFVVGKNCRYFVDYNSPMCVLMAVAAFLFFKESNICKGEAALQSLSSVAFDVYIAHSHILVFDYLINDAFVWVRGLPVYLVIPAILVLSIAIYAVCAVLGWLREKIFEITSLNQLMKKCSAAIDKVVYGKVFES